MSLRSHSFVLFLAVITPTSAAVIVDQEHLPGMSMYILDYPEDYIAQTFTVRNTGHLVGLGLQISIHDPYSNLQPITDDLYMRLIRTDPAGRPDITKVLASATIYPSELPTGYATSMVIERNIADWGVEVNEGDVLAIALSSSHTYYSHGSINRHRQYSWHGQFRDPHPGGDFYIYSPKQWGPEPHKIVDRFVPPQTRDMAFRILIDRVPEPTSAALGCAAALLLGMRRPRRAAKAKFSVFRRFQKERFGLLY